MGISNSGAPRKQKRCVQAKKRLRKAVMGSEYGGGVGVETIVIVLIVRLVVTEVMML